jgi:predicted peptidase
MRIPLRPARLARSTPFPLTLHLALAAVAALALAAPAFAEDRVLELPDGNRVRYGLHLPSSMDDPVPLIIGLHYAWGGEAPPAYYGRDYMNVLVVPALAEVGAIIAAPDCPDRHWGTPHSETAILALIESLASEFDIDRDRIVITGFSRGGMGTWTFVAHHPELVSAAIPVAGYPEEGIIAGWGDTPVLAVHSEADAVVPIAPTREGIAALQARGITAELIAVPGLPHHQTSRFATPLKAAVAWLESVWATASSR